MIVSKMFFKIIFALVFITCLSFIDSTNSNKFLEFALKSFYLVAIVVANIDPKQNGIYKIKFSKKWILVKLESEKGFSNSCLY